MTDLSNPAIKLAKKSITWKVPIGQAFFFLWTKRWWISTWRWEPIPKVVKGQIRTSSANKRVDGAAFPAPLVSEDFSVTRRLGSDLVAFFFFFFPPLSTGLLTVPESCRGDYKSVREYYMNPPLSFWTSGRIQLE